MDLRKFSTNKIRHSFEELCLILIVDDRLLVLTGRRISVAAYAHLSRDTCVPRSGSGQTHQNYSDKNCNISNCKTLIINVLDLLILDIFRIFTV